MGIGEAGAAEGNKPQAHTDKRPSAGSEQAFNEALRRSEGSASSTQAAAGTTARASAGKPAIVRIDANYRSKSATATLSDGSKVPLALTKNQLAPGDTLHNLEYGPESGPEDSPVVELSCASGASCSILWTQPSNYALSPKVIVSIKQDPEEGARRRLEQLPQYIQDYVNQVGGENLESRAKMGEDLVKTGAKKEDFAPVEIQAKAPADPDFKFVEAARKGRYSQFPSFDEFKKGLEAQVAYAKQQVRTNGLNPPDPFEGAEWKDNPAAAKEKWDKYVFAQYDKAVKNEAAGLRHVGEVASMAQNAIFEALGLSAALGTGGAFLAAGGEALALPTLLESSTGVSTSTWFGTFAKFGLGTSFGMNLINRSREGIDAGSNPVSVVSAAATDTFGGKVVEKFTNESNLTGEKLNLSTGERVTGGITDLIDGGMNILGVREFAKMPGVGEPPLPRGTSAEPTGTDTPPPNDAIAKDAGKLAAPAKPDYRLNGPVTLSKPTTDITLTREARPVNWVRGVDPGPAFEREGPATSGGSSASAPGPGRSPAAEGRTRPVNPNGQMAVGNDGPPQGPKPPAKPDVPAAATHDTKPEIRGDVKGGGVVEPVRQGVVGGTIGGDTENILGTLGIAPENLPDLREGRWVSGTMTRGSGQTQTRFRYDGDRLTASVISGDNPPSNIDLAAIRHQSIQLGEELGAQVVRLQIEMVGQEHAAFLQANNFKPVDGLDGIFRLDIPIEAAPIKAAPIEAAPIAATPIAATPKITSQFTRAELNVALQKLVPKGQDLQTWGGMIWGGGEKGALSLIGTRSRAQLLQIKGLTLESATQLRDIMLGFQANGLGGAAPAYRVQLLNDIIKTLGG